MSSHHLRNEKNCLNCGKPIEHRYCGHCGQENTEPRQTFGHLVTHFFEDLTHYEGKFWGTLRYLFFKPAFLTKEFIAGKRSKYLPPVRLYIFASFLTFLLPSLLPEPPDNIGEHQMEIHTTASRTDSSHSNAPDTGRFYGYNESRGLSFPSNFNTKAEIDSAREARKNTDDPMSYAEYLYNKKTIDFSKYSSEMLMEIFKDAFSHNFPKALFIYMPLFALILSLFHRKRNWIYFDHGIFTLHYFSFLLLQFLWFSIFLNGIAWLVSAEVNETLLYGVFVPVTLLFLMWSIIYFYRAHYRMYEEHSMVSFLKATGILLINVALFIIIFLALVLITLLMLH